MKLLTKSQQFHCHKTLKMKNIITVLCIYFIWIIPISSQNIQAGEITANLTSSSLTPYYNINVELYVKGSINGLDSITVNMSDGTIQNFLLQNVIPINDSITHLRFIKNHVFPGIGNYYVFFRDSTINSDLRYLSNNNEVQIFIELYIGNPAFLLNNTPTFNYYPTIINHGDSILIDCSASDIDGDSIDYQIFHFPVNFYDTIPVTDTIYVNQSGMLVWKKPPQVGKYVLAVEIADHRWGARMGTVYRQFVVDIDSSMVFTNTKQIKKESGFEVFPNPTTSTITIATPNFKNKTLTLYSMLGEALETHRLTSPQHELDLSRYAAGMYIVQLSDGRQVWSRKVVKW